jgi:DNA-binding GntR family transcriptional regulator
LELLHAIWQTADMLYDETVVRLRELLIEGRIVPGERIPEHAVCAMLGISRTPLREALKVLAAEGHVVLLPNRGARAAKLTSKDTRDLFEAAAALEAAAGELACLHITEEQVRRIAEQHGKMVAFFERGDLESYYTCNRLIHQAIVHASDNPVLISLYEGIDTRIRRARYVAPMTDDHWRTAMLEHEAMLNGLRRRDGPMLAMILKTHLRYKAADVETAGFAEPA